MTSSVSLCRARFGLKGWYIERRFDVVAVVDGA
jgi:hypothetical protein